MVRYVPIGENLLPKYRFLWMHFFDLNKSVFKNIFRIFAQFFKTLEKLLFLKPDYLVYLSYCSRKAHFTAIIAKYEM